MKVFDLCCCYRWFTMLRTSSMFIFIQHARHARYTMVPLLRHALPGRATTQRTRVPWQGRVLFRRSSFFKELSTGWCHGGIVWGHVYFYRSADQSPSALCRDYPICWQVLSVCTFRFREMQHHGVMLKLRRKDHVCSSLSCSREAIQPLARFPQLQWW